MGGPGSYLDIEGDVRRVLIRSWSCSNERKNPDFHESILRSLNL